MENYKKKTTGNSQKILMNKNPREIDIFLIPPISNPIFTESSEKFMPLGLLAIAASLRSKKFRTQIYQPWKTLFTRDDHQEVAREIVSIKPKIIGFSTWCITYPTSLNLAEAIKSLDPDIPIIFGGPQASILDRETLTRYSCVDFVLRGEADITIIDLVKCLINGANPYELKKIHGLTYRIPGNNKIIRNKNIGYIANLNTLPIPAYDLIPLNKNIKLDVGRGCPFKCTFCTTSDFFSKSYRIKSISRIIQEMDYCFEKTGITFFGFAHDMFTLDKKYMLELCKTLKKHYKRKAQRYTWTCSARTDCVSDEMLKAMKEAGCTTIFFGIESGSDHIQKMIKKNIKIPQAYKVAETCSSIGINMIVSFMAGFPEETKKDINDTIKVILEMSARGSIPQMSLLSLLPGTPLYETCKDKLEYDGRFSDFSGFIFGKDELKMIKENPDLFSSFYYLPIKDINRDNLFSLSRLVNDFRNFPDTINMIREYLKKDIKSVSMFDFLEKQLMVYRKEENSGYPELFCLVDGLNDYLTYLEKKGLPFYAWEIFILETAKLFMQKKFIRRQLIQPRKGVWGKLNDKFDIEDHIVSTTHWKLVTTNYKISSILEKNKKGNLSGIKLRRGQYKYLVVACSEKKSIFMKLTEKQYKVMEKLGDMRVIDFFEVGRKFMDEIAFWKFLRKLARIGIVEVDKKQA